MSDPKFTIRQMCDQFQVTPRTLRFYESKELIAPERAGQRRLYSKREVGRIKLILLGKKFGFSLEELRQLLDMYYLEDAQATQLEETFKVAQKHLSDMKVRRDELNDTIVELERRIKWGEEMIASQRQEKAAK